MINKLDGYMVSMPLAGYHEYMSNPYPTHWPLVWRGESSGVLFDQFDLAKTNEGSGFFFAQNKDHAAWYASSDTHPRAFLIDPGNCLDLRDPYHAYIKNPAVRTLIDDLRSEFDEWIDRETGEECHPNDFLDAGTLYAYEGNGRGQRWHTLFRLAWAQGFDSVVVHDATDSPRGEDVATTWVVKDPSQITPAPSIEINSSPNSTRPRAQRKPG